MPFLTSAEHAKICHCLF